jgi:hypothetical protein
VLALGTRAGAADWYVATNGAGTPGTAWNTAFTNIQTALNAATNNDTIYLAGHTFGITTQLVWTTSYVTVRGGYAATNAEDKPGTNNPALWPTVIRPANATNRILYINAVTNGTVEGVTLTGGTASDYGGAVRIANSPGILFSGCIVSNNTATGNAAGGGAFYASSSGLTLSNCLMKGNSSCAIFSNGGGNGGAIWSDGTLTLRDTCVLDNRTFTTAVNADRRGAGVYFAGTAAYFKSALIAGNDSEANAGDGIYLAGGTMRLENCTVADNGGQGLNRAGGTLAATNCIIWGNGDDLVNGATVSYCAIQTADTFWTNGVNGCTSGDPLLEYGYYLGAGSPCVDAGTNTAAFWGLSGGTTRTDGSGDAGTVDMGYHYPTGYDLSRADLYVATTGNDGNSGTSSAQALRTVTKALAMAWDGTCVHVATGTYSTAGGEVFPLTVNGLTGLRILGTNAAQTILSAASAAQRVIGLTLARRFDVSGLTLTGGSADYGGAVRIVRSPNVRFSDCIVSNNTATGTSAAGGAFHAWSSDLTLSNCLVRGNLCNQTWIGGAQGNGGAIWGDGGSTLTLRDSRVLYNRTSTTYTPNMYGGGVYFNGTAWFRNTLIAGNDSGANAGDGIYLAGGTMRLENCTVADNGGQGLNRAAGTLAATNCVIWGNGDDLVNGATVSYCAIQTADTFWTNGVNGCTNSNPRLEYGYYLGDGSPCVDAGTNTAAFWGLSGYTTRSDGSGDTGTVDMGYHYPTGFDLSRADLYVATTGNDGNSGTNRAEAVRSMTRALAMASDGTRIHVASGLYTTNSGEVFPLTVASLSGVSIAGTNAADTVLSAAGAGQRLMTVSLAANLDVSGLTLTRGSADFGGAVRVMNSPSVRFSGCIVTNNTATGNTAGGGAFYATSSDLTLSNCLVKGNSSSATYNNTSDGGGIWSDGTLTLRETCVLSNTAASSSGTGGRQGGGIYFQGITAWFKNALIAGNDSKNAGDAIYLAGGTMRLENCTVADNGGQGLNRAAGSMVATNCILWGNGVDATGTMTIAWSDVGVAAQTATTNLCISVNPLFVDTTYYHLQSRGGNYVGGYFEGGAWGRSSADSPCIDAGDPASDYAREPAPNGKRVNMGCYGNTVVASATKVPSGSLILIR